MIAEKVASIPSLLYNTKKHVYIEDHTALNLLAYPNSDNIESEFIEALAKNYLISGNCYIKAEGFIENHQKHYSQFHRRM